MHDQPPSTDEIRAHIWATTPCTCTPRIVVRRHSHGHTRVQARHEPCCPVRVGHQRINLNDQ
jgi:hypothetical protein